MIRNIKCPACRHLSLKNISGYEFDHVGECPTRGKHVFNRYYSGFRCVLCGWTNRMSKVK